VRLSGLALLLVTVAAWTMAFSHGATVTKMTASVKPCQIVRSDGRTQEPRHGSFAFVVNDTSRTRYFSFSGHGIAKSTTARFVGTTRWQLRLGKGTYRFRCGAGRALSGTLAVG